MNGGGRIVVILVGVVLLSAAAAGVPVMPHRWVGLTTADLIGIGMVLFVPALLVFLALESRHERRQIKRHLAENTRQLNELRGRRKVIQGPWRRSG